MRALFLNENIGGHATVHLGLGAELSRWPDLEVEFLDVPAAGLIRRAARAAVPVLGHRDMDLAPLRGQIGAAVIARRLLTHRAVRAADVLHVYTQTAGFLSTAVMRSRPTVVMTDATAEMNGYRLPYRSPGRGTPTTVGLTRRFEARVYAAATIVVANSQWAGESLRSYGIPEDRLRVRPVGVVVPRGPLRRELTDPPTIVYVGRSLERKGGRRLMELWSQHLSQRCRLVMVTNEHISPPPGVEVRNDIRPGDGKLAELFVNCSALVFPSLMDLAPNAVLEAMAHGVAVVAYADGSVPEMIEDGVSGRLVTPGDEAALVEAIAEVVGDPERAARLGQAARARVLADYDMRHSADDLVGILTEATEVWADSGPIR
jgi:starch synthase